MQHYQPPYITPPVKITKSLSMLRDTANCVIKTWPQEMYHDDFYQPPVNGLLYVMSTSAIRQIMIEQADNFPQSKLTRRIIKPIWRGGIAATFGDKWRWQRKAATPVFTPRAVSSIVPAVNDASKTLVDIWHASPSKSVDVTVGLGNAAATVVLDTLLNGFSSLSVRTDLLRHGNKLSIELGRINYADIFRLPNWTRKFLGPTFTNTAGKLHDIVASELEQKCPVSGNVKSLLDLLVNARDPDTGKSMSNELLKDNIVGALAAGRDTTALSVTWALFLVASHEPTEKRIVAEINKTIGKRQIKSVDINNLKFTKCVLMEAMRLYPPAPQIVRDCINDTEIDGMQIKAGTLVNIPIYTIHRHQKYWRLPNTFEPERFHEDNYDEHTNRFNYLPFGAGSRLCLGKAFAMTEAIVLLANLLREFKFTLPNGIDVEFEVGAALRPKNGMHLEIEQR